MSAPEERPGELELLALAEELLEALGDGGWSRSTDPRPAPWQVADLVGALAG